MADQALALLLLGVLPCSGRWCASCLVCPNLICFPRHGHLGGLESIRAPIMQHAFIPVHHLVGFGMAVAVFACAWAFWLGSSPHITGALSAAGRVQTAYQGGLCSGAGGLVRYRYGTGDSYRFSLISVLPGGVQHGHGLRHWSRELQDVLRSTGCQGKLDIPQEGRLPRSMPVFFRFVKVSITLGVRSVRSFFRGTVASNLGSAPDDFCQFVDEHGVLVSQAWW